MSRNRPWRHLGALLILLVVALQLHAETGAAIAVDSLNINLDPLIDNAAPDRNRFAVNIPHSISTSSQGVWTHAGSTSTWTYNTRVPTAISMSLHASHLALPPSAVLTVTAKGSSRATYRAKDISRGGLWSRPLIGDTLEINVSVNTTEASQVQLQIDSLQAGYRALGGDIADHPHYRQIMAAQAASATTTSSCSQNYSCNATAANQGPAQATVALLVGDQYQCTGTLLNNTRGDGTPYVLTARHCETGKLGGGDPSAAGSVVVYWDAVTACGQSLQSIYYDGTTQSGAVTVVEQQDAWLIRLDVPPVANDAFYAGWDASGGIFTGGYSIHHALGNDRQYVSWYGQALLQQISAASLQVGYNSTFWGVVNQLGDVGAGSSGGALFDPNNNVVGSGTLANLISGTGSAGVCPATPSVAPTNSNVAAQYTSLAAVWTSTVDPTSTTGGATLQSVLDPDNTGEMTVSGFGLTPITVSIDNSGPALGQTVTLSWNVAGAKTCIAAGGISGDGWVGTYGASGAVSLTEFTPGEVPYSLTCAIGNLEGHATTSVYWNFVAATTGLVGPSSPVMAGGTLAVSWSANVTPCVASGGVAGDGWAGSKAAYGIQNLPATQIGTLTYTLSCGSGARAASTTITTYVLAPYVTMSASATQIRAGEDVALQWSAGGASGGQCVPSGGSSSDSWTAAGTAGNTTLSGSGLSGSGQAVLTESTAGTYTYTLTCSGGGQTSSAGVTVVYVTDPPAISLTAVAPQQQVYAISTTTTATAATASSPDLLWNSNVGGCFLTATGPTGPRAVTLEGQYPTGSAADMVYTPGQYTYTLQCGILQASTTINWATTIQQPSTVLTASATRWVANTPYSLSWSSVTGPCTAGGGSASDGWAGTINASGSQTVSESAQGTYLFTVSCGSGTQTSQAQIAVIVGAPTVTLTASPNYLIQGSPTTLSWTSTLAPCTYLDGSQSAPAVAVAPTAAATSNPANGGTYLYTVTCGSAAQTIRATTQVSVQAPTTLSASLSNASVNAPVTLTWNSPGSVVCIPSGAAGSASWQGALGGSGTVTVTGTTAGTVTYEINCNTGIAGVAVNYTAPDTTTTSDPTTTVTPTDPTAPSGSSTSSGVDPTSGGKGGGGALDPFWLLLFSIPLALRVGYSSRKPTVTGMRAARTAGNKPPIKPIASAHVSPLHNKAGETLNANTT
jgi:hypothetical protein